MPDAQVNNSQKKEDMSVSFIKAARVQIVAVKNGDYLKELLAKGLDGAGQ